MNLDFSELFHQFSKDHSRGHAPIDSDPNNWPQEWHTTYYKTYPRFPKIKLKECSPSGDFFQLVMKRESRRDFKQAPFSNEDLSILLKFSCGLTGKTQNGRSRRAQPSGGARFPLEVYPLVLTPGSDLAAGVYHYNVKEHSLDVLDKREISNEEIGKLFTYPWVKNASLVLLVTAMFWRNKNKYGERGYRYILLEAGHIGQNIYLAAEALGLQCCALGGTRDILLEKLLDIDGTTESPVYALALGK